MAKYEIINPSDKCFISSENREIARACGNILGNGFYGLVEVDTGETALRIFESPFEDEKEYQEFIDRNRIRLAECFESFEYAGECTSLNDIQKSALSLANALRNREGSADAP